MSFSLPPEPNRQLLSEQLEELRQTFADRAATLRQILGALGGRAYTLLIVVFTLPFAPPVTVPGASTPLGLIIAAIAVQLALGKLPWLPKRVLEWRLPAGFFSKLVPLTARIVRWIERVLHPRWPAWTSGPVTRATHFGVIVACGLILAIPVPIPFTNFLPGWAILLIACGILERDGIFILVGHIVFVLNLVYWVLIGGAAWTAWEKMWAWMAS